ncbi:efflux RND transporter periplasmic adaptor subunit [Hyphococcus luteus]|uniref:Efflux transporter periplasmic adaptor subunit n=1 Tax=Hyphococcus luteus TaxID=2058213 RepID=A0A2S7K3C7_9PROT|nr:efflux RND transporter periplasmic adaptor subunit [Marinicaulis flavus]PQA87010.1 efflux transporter periplasmic adaptor subunit [Marinicaulis flavus]
MAAALLVGCGGEQNAAMQRPAPEVAVETVKTQTVRLSVTLPGRTASYRVAEVRPQVSGIILERTFEEGAAVAAGQPLYQIDPAPYQAAVDSAAASMARAEAMVVAAENREERFARLVKVNGVSKQDFDDAAAAAKQARAEVALARAALESAKIDLERTTIKAPIDGRIGRTLVTSGALVNANQAQELAIINALDPIYVDVSQSSAELLRLKRKLASGELETLDDGQLEVNLTLEDGGAYEHPGQLALTEVNVEPGTGSITLRAVFPNPEGLLLPGMFVRAEIIEGARDDAILVPQQAVTRNPQGEGVVYVVNADNKIEERIVKVDRAIGDKWLIASGLKPGERIVVEGFQRIRPGAEVSPVELSSPASDGAVAASNSSGMQ